MNYWTHLPTAGKKTEHFKFTRTICGYENTTENCFAGQNKESSPNGTVIIWMRECSSFGQLAALKKINVSKPFALIFVFFLFFFCHDRNHLCHFVSAPHCWISHGSLAKKICIYYQNLNDGIWSLGRRRKCDLYTDAHTIHIIHRVDQ